MEREGENDRNRKKVIKKRFSEKKKEKTREKER